MRLHLAGAAAFVMTCLPSHAAGSPKIWIFNGDPGDEAHHERYEKNLTSLRETLHRTYAVPAADLRIFYGPEETGYHGVCTRETMLAELGEAAAATRDGRPAWIILQGHANSIPGGAVFNLPGPDVSARDMAGALEKADPETALVIFVTTAASERFLRPLAAPGRIVITANSSGDPENETDFPLALAAALEAAGTDADGDGFVSVTEIFKACHAKIESMAAEAGYMIREHAQMDGNGDGRATRRPAAADAGPASEVGLHIGGGPAGRSFD